MKKFKRILLATDFSRFANNALPFAVQMAQMYNSELHVVHVYNKIEQGLSKRRHQQNSGKISSDFDALKKIIKIDKERLFFIPVAENSVEAGIINYIKDHKIDLVVLGTYGIGWSGSFFLGSVAEQITRHAPCSALTVSRKSREDISNILVPVDFSKYSKKAVSMAKDLANKYNARLSLLHVVEPGYYPKFYNINENDYKKLLTRSKRKSPNYLKKLFDEAPGPKVKVDIFVIIGQPAHQIIKFVDDYEPDLTVISSHGLTDIDYFLMGDVADKVIKRATCPVLSLKLM